MIKKEIKLTAISLFFIVIIVSGCSPSSEKINQKRVREPVFSGTWYPGTEADLNTAIDGFLNNVKKIEFNGSIRAIIVPHAGYTYSGQVAATAYKQLADDYGTIFLLGPSHKYPLNGASIPNVTHYKTPLGEVSLSKKAEEMIKEEIIASIIKAHENEHSLEIQLPFLQKQLSNLEIVPIVVGNSKIDRFKNVFLKYFSKKDLLIVSVDLSHYHEYDEAKELDAYSMDRIVNLDDQGIFQAEIDAPWAVATLLSIAKEKNWKPVPIYYANSGDVSGDKSSVVGYSTVVFIEEKSTVKELSSDEQLLLLKLARETAETYLKTGKKPEVDEAKLTPSLKKVQGCFTTFNKNNQLRGCIGHILPQEELYKCVMDNAISAAVNDRRFQPVVIDEMKDIDIEISVLTVPQVLEFSSGEDLKNKLRPMVDGVVLSQGRYGSTYLPQVWESFASKEAFLSQLCTKGGMPEDCWQDTSTEVKTYQAFVFEEHG